MFDSDRFLTALNKKRESAWSLLYDEFYSPLCAYAAKLTQHDAGVEDLVQECIIGLWKSTMEFRDIDTLAMWLYKSVYNRSLNLIRDRKISQRVLDNYRVELACSEEEAIDLAIEEAAIAKVRKVLSMLSPQQEQIIRMSLEGLKVVEIAERLGVSDNAVKVQKKRAYATIRERLGVVWGPLFVTFFSDFL